LAEHFLILLDKHTQTNEQAELLQGDIRRALDAGVHLILIHETRVERGGCSFKEIMDGSPRDLQVRPGGMYDELAIEMCDGEHARVSLRMSLLALVRPDEQSVVRRLSDWLAGRPTTPVYGLRVAEGHDSPSRPSLSVTLPRSLASWLEGVTTPLRSTPRGSRERGDRSSFNPKFWESVRRSLRRDGDSDQVMQEPSTPSRVYVALQQQVHTVSES